MPTELMLRQLLTANRTNDMARAYLIAQHLLAGKLDELETDLAPFERDGRGRLPRPCEEAIVLGQH
jgi:hypothetical protein